MNPGQNSRRFEPFWKIGGHHCSIESYQDFNFSGAAATRCRENVYGYFVVFTRAMDFGNAVNYCPFCGTQAPMTIAAPVRLNPGSDNET